MNIHYFILKKWDDFLLKFSGRSSANIYTSCKSGQELSHEYLLFTCKHWLRYSRERASQNLRVNSCICSFASLVSMWYGWMYIRILRFTAAVHILTSPALPPPPVMALAVGAKKGQARRPTITNLRRVRERPSNFGWTDVREEAKMGVGASKEQHPSLFTTTWTVDFRIF